MAEYIEKATLLNRVIIPSICSCVQGPTAERLKKFCIDTVNNISAADVAPVVHGRWVVDVAQFQFLMCSSCGTFHYTGTRSTQEANVLKSHWYNYCPNCGAKMDIDEEGDM